MTKLLKLSGKIWFHRAKALAELQRYDDAANSIEKSLESLARHDDAEFTEALTLLPTYLVEAGDADSLYKWLTNFDFMESKLSAFGLQALINDYELANHAKIQLSEEKAESLKLIQGALQLSIHSLLKDKSQLLPQLLGRLLFFEEPTQTLLAGVNQKKAPRLYPLSPSLIPPGRALVRNLIGHTESVETVAVTPDSQRIVSGSRDNTIKVWDLHTGEELLTITGNTDSRTGKIAITPDGQKIVSGSANRTLKVWDLHTGEELLTLSGHSDRISSVAVTPDGKKVISGSNDKTVKIWDLHSGQEILTLSGHEDQVKAIAVTPDGTKLVSGSSCSLPSIFQESRWNIKVWDIQTGIELQNITGNKGEMLGIAITSDSNHIVTVSTQESFLTKTETIEIWDIQTGQRLEGLGLPLCSWLGNSAVAVAPDGKQIVSGSKSDSVMIWNWQKGQFQNGLFRTLRGHTGYIRDLAVTPDGKWIVSGSDDNTVKIWDLQNPKRLPPTIFGKTHSYADLIAIAPDGKKAVLADFGNLKIWDLKNGKKLREIKAHEESIKAVAFTPDSKKLVSAPESDWVKVWDLDSGEEIFTLNDYRVVALAVTPDGKKVVSGSKKKTIKVWDLESGQELHTLNGHTESVSTVAITPDGKKAVSGSFDHTLKIWDLESGQELRTLSGHSLFVDLVAITPDGKKVISASRDSTIKVWDLHSGEDLLTLSHIVNDFVLTPDGTKIISRIVANSFSDVNASTLKVWDLQSGEELVTLSGHTEYIVKWAIAPNSQHIVSVSGDRSLRIWDWQTGTTIASFHADSELCSCAIACDGLSIVAGDRSGQMHLLRFNPDDSETLSASSFIVGEFQKAEKLVNQGKDLGLSGKPDETIKFFDRALSLQPDLYEAWWYRARVLSEFETVESAWERYQSLYKAHDCLNADDEEYSQIFFRVMQAKQDLPRTIFNRAIDKNSAGDKKGAIEDLNMVLQLEEKFAPAYCLRASIYNMLDQYRAALEDCDRAINLGTEDSLDLAYGQRGKARRGLEDYSGAIEDFTRSIQINPDAHIYCDRGITRIIIGDIEGAFKDFSEAIQIDPSFANAYYNRGLIFYNLDEKQAALEDYTQAIRIDPSLGSAYHNRGIVRSDMGDDRGAIADYGKAIQLQPNNLNAYDARAKALARMKYYQEAIEDFTQAIKLNPNHESLHLKRGLCRRFLEDYYGAIQDYTQEIKINPSCGEAYLSRSTVHTQIRNIREAKNDVRIAAELFLEQGDTAKYQDAIKRLRIFDQIPDSYGSS